eukprot:TRINITY_DN14367_c0_g1_i5.p1 TRINITY_DN14367_c0_g1~~TRINITY_DN14367_c0_g1_i5.p1  ORF type:complete len:487 (-),score=66.29 TRINITY_DN14367_c0_g1_i5:45-1505(-)
MCIRDRKKENHKFGLRTDRNEMVDNVILPSWAKHNPYIYVARLRELLEEDQHEKLEQWIDLIFGYLQRGPNAKKAFNLFPPITYDPAKILSRLKPNDSLCNAYRLQAYHWGQTPQQLIQRKHRARTSRVPKVFWENPKTVSAWSSHQKVNAMLSNEFGTFSLLLANDILQTVVIDLGHANVITMTSARQVNSTLKTPFNPLDPLLSSPILLLVNKKPGYIARGGYWDGSIQLLSLDAQKRTSIILMYHCSTITAMAKDKYERLAIVGTKHGECAVYGLHEGMFWKPESLFTDHEGPITSLHVSDGMQLFLTSGLDGVVNVYELDCKPKLLRAIRHGIPVTEAFLTQSPLPGLVVLSESVSKIAVYGINGKLLTEVTEENIISSLIVENARFMEHIVYAKGENLIVRKLPFLEFKIIKMQKKEKIVQIAGCGKCLLLLHNDNTISLVYCPVPTHNNSMGLSLIHISEPTRPLYISYAVFCLKKKKKK